MLNRLKVPVIYTVIILIYLLTLSPLVSIQGEFYKYEDYFFVVLGSCILISVFFVPSVKKVLFENLNVKEAFKLKNILISIITLLILSFSMESIILLDPLAHDNVKNNIRFNFTTQYSLILILAMISIGPIWEEIYFRGILIIYSKIKLPAWLSVLSYIFSLVFFSFIHADYPLFGLLLGIILTIVVLITRSLFQVILLHVIWNVIIILYNYY